VSDQPTADLTGAPDRGHLGNKVCKKSIQDETIPDDQGREMEKILGGLSSMTATMEDNRTEEMGLDSKGLR